MANSEGMPAPLRTREDALLAEGGAAVVDAPDPASFVAAPGAASALPDAASSSSLTSGPKHPLLNHVLFGLFTLVLGALAGLVVWLFFFLMDAGLELFWHALPQRVGAWWWPLLVCPLGGVAIGLFERRFGPYPESLKTVMAQVKETGRYDYGHLGASAGGALLPLLFGGSVGPEAGLTGVIAGLCTWVGDRLKFLGREFRELSSVGTAAVLSAVFGAPLFGMAAPLVGSCDEVEPGAKIEVPRTTKIIVYSLAVAGAFGVMVLMRGLFGGGSGLPHFTEMSAGRLELALLVPLALAGAVVGLLYHAFDGLAARAAARAGDRPVLKAVLAGLVLGALGSFSPFVMFAGETQTETLAQMWGTLGVGFLLATAVLKVFATPLCLHFGWRGGHFFPTIFAGVCLGYAFAALTGADPVSCLSICCAALVGAVMRQPVMAVLLLFLLFPVRAFVLMMFAAIIGSALASLLKLPTGNAKRAGEASDPRKDDQDDGGASSLFGEASSKVRG